MEDGVRRGEARPAADRSLARGVRAKGGQRVRMRRPKLLRRTDQGTWRSRAQRIEAGPRGRRAKVARDGGLTSEPGMRVLRQSHPLVYAMLVELCTRQRPGRVIRLRRA